MSADGGVIVTGRVLDVELKQGNMGTDRAYSYQLAHILTGTKVTEVRFGDQLRAPSQGDEVTLDVDLSAYRDRVTVRARSYLAPLAAAAA